jgi:ubiquitin-like domain-containing CTD phosphatase 1
MSEHNASNLDDDANDKINDISDNDDNDDNDDDDEEDDETLSPTVTLIAKYNKEKYEFPGWPLHTTIGEIKSMIQRRTNILPKRQKLIGLIARNGGAKAVTDDLTLGELQWKKSSSNHHGTSDENCPLTITHTFILMGTPEADIFVDPQDRLVDSDNNNLLPDVIDDFDLDFYAGSTEWLQHVANLENLKKFTTQTMIHVMNEPRMGKPLLVLDLDHTLLDFSSKTLQRDASTTVVGSGVAALMKRPYMDQFLVDCYVHYDLVVWSQTSWRWLETKLTELGMITHPGYKFCFVLDKTSMFTVTSTKRDRSAGVGGGGEISVQHHVKPLQIIWSKFATQWNTSNTVHVDDLQRNFALNPFNGMSRQAGVTSFFLCLFDTYQTEHYRAFFLTKYFMMS